MKNSRLSRLLHSNLLGKSEAGGIRLRDAKALDESELLSNLQADLVKIISGIDGIADGVLFLIDEADKAPATANLGQLCKLLTEALSKRSCDRLCVGLAGLPGLIGTLRESHESSQRMFKTMNLKPLEPREREQVLDIGMTEATKEKWL